MRHAERLYEQYKSYNKFFKDNKIKITKEEIGMYYDEFCSSKSLSVHKKNSQTFFDYLINRLHILGLFNMFDYSVPLHHNGHTAMYYHDSTSWQYVGYIEGHLDYTITGKTVKEIEEDFKNMVDFVL